MLYNIDNSKLVETSVTEVFSFGTDNNLDQKFKQHLFGCKTHLYKNEHLLSAMKLTYNVLYEQEREKTWIE